MSQEIVHRLVPRLPHLRTDLGLDPESGLPLPGAAEADLHLEQLPYCLGAAWTAVQRLVLSLQHLEQLPDVQQIEAGQRKILTLSAEQRDPLAYEVDAFLGAARRAQNATVPYLTRAYSQSLPASLAKLAAQLRSGKRSIHPEVDAVILGYWQAAGSRLKAYRDLGEHHAIVASDARVVRAPTGKLYAYLALPNNPDEKSATKLSYDPPVHALDFVIGKALLPLCAFVSRLVEIMAEGVPQSGMVAVTFSFKGQLKLGRTWPPDVFPVLSESDLDSAISTLRQTEDRWAQRRRGEDQAPTQDAVS